MILLIVPKSVCKSPVTLQVLDVIITFLRHNPISDEPKEEVTVDSVGPTGCGLHACILIFEAHLDDQA